MHIYIVYSMFDSTVLELHGCFTDDKQAKLYRRKLISVEFEKRKAYHNFMKLSQVELFKKLHSQCFIRTLEADNPNSTDSIDLSKFQTK